MSDGKIGSGKPGLDATLGSIANATLGAGSSAPGSVAAALTPVASSVFQDTSGKPNPGTFLGYTTIFVEVDDGPPHALLMRRYLVREGTWLSMTCLDSGWDRFFTKDEGYGAYELSIVIPETLKPRKDRFGWGPGRASFDPDLVFPGDVILIRQPPSIPEPEPQAPDTVPEEDLRKFELRTLAGAGVGFPPLAAQAFSIEIRNPRNGRTQAYTYAGLGIGGGIGLVTPSGWTPVTLQPTPGKQLQLPIAVEDFEGNGTVTSLGAGRSGSAFVFDSIDAVIQMEGWELQLGGEADVVGRWIAR